MADAQRTFPSFLSLSLWSQSGPVIQTLDSTQKFFLTCLFSSCLNLSHQGVKTFGLLGLPEGTALSHVFGFLYLLQLLPRILLHNVTGVADVCSVSKTALALPFWEALSQALAEG